MIHKFIIFLILLVIQMNTIHCKKKNDTLNSSDKISTEEPGTETDIIWKQDPKYGWNLVLHADGSLEYHFAGEGCGHFKGTYVKTNSGFTYSGKGDEEDCGNVSSGIGECTTNDISDNLYFQKELNCTGPLNTKLFSDYIQTSLERNLGEIPVFTVNREGFIKEEAFIRTNPSKSANPTECKFETEEGPKKMFTLQGGKSVSVIASTRRKEKVDKWENYWYYVDAGDWYNECQGWVFGEFIVVE